MNKVSSIISIMRLQVPIAAFVLIVNYNNFKEGTFFRSCLYGLGFAVLMSISIGIDRSATFKRNEQGGDRKAKGEAGQP